MSIKDLVCFFYETGTLRKINRAHKQTLLGNDESDNIASHSFRVAVIGYFLAKLCKIDENKVLKMCLFHDFTEARANDQNWVHKKYVKVFEDEITRDQFKKQLKDKEVFNLIQEYNQKKTKEAQIAKDADLLDQVILLKEYEHSGCKEAGRWLKDVKGESQQEKMMHTGQAKKIAKEIKKQTPSDWWENLWTAKRR